MALLSLDEYERISMALRGEHPPPLGRLRRPPLKPFLTEDQVREIRASKESLKTAAARFGICKNTVWKVRNRETWDWLPD